MRRPKILVVGSMNMDLYMKGAECIPKFGQSIMCGNYGCTAGGKGANQAVAAAFQGAEVAMAGRVGGDEYGRILEREMENAGVSTRFLVRDFEKQTGLALMLLNKDGRYVSYVSLGANEGLCPEDVKNALEIERFDLVMLQLEIPLETVYGTLELAEAKEIPVFLDAGPARSLPLERLRGLYILSPNEAETEALTGINPNTEERAVRAARCLYDKARPAHVILKLGSRGAFLYDRDHCKRIPCFKVKAVDSTAAGDTFGAALAVRLCIGDSMEKAVRFAHGAAAICVSRMGARSSIPGQAETAAFIKEDRKDG